MWRDDHTYWSVGVWCQFYQIYLSCGRRSGVVRRGSPHMPVARVRFFVGDEMSSEFDTVRRAHSSPLAITLPFPTHVVASPDARCRGNRDVSAPAASVDSDWSESRGRASELDAYKSSRGRIQLLLQRRRWRRQQENEGMLAIKRKMQLKTKKNKK